MDKARSDRWPALTPALRTVAGATCVVVGVFTAFLTVALGHCSAFGGRCAENDALRGDVFGGTAFGVALAVAAPVLAVWPTRRGAVVAAVSAALTGVPAGLVALWLTGRS